MKTILAVCLSLFLFGCTANQEIVIDPDSPLQRAIIISGTRMSTAVYLDKNGSEGSVMYVQALGLLMSEFDTSENSKLSCVEIQADFYDKGFNQMGDDLSIVAKEAVRAALDTTFAAIYQYASQQDDVVKEYLNMIALAGINIAEVAELYEVPNE